MMYRFLTFLALTGLISVFGFGQEEPQQVYLWPNGAPGFQDRKDEPELAKDWWAKNIHNPSITVYEPSKEKLNGAAVLICPGGGHRELVINPEGKDPALFLNELGITAFVLKYRLAREEGSPYKLEAHPKQDVFRAMRYIRSNAEKFGLDTTRIGIMGFSAGGEVVAMIAYDEGLGDMSSQDPIEKANAKPDFQILIYPGPLFIPKKIEADAPPAFLLGAIDDPCCIDPVISLIQKYKTAGIPAEAHIYSKGGHGFNMGDRSKLVTINSWPQRLADWLRVQNILEPELKK